MINEKFLDFVKEVVPSIDRNKFEELKQCIKNKKWFNYESYYSYKQDDLVQGDVIDGVKFILTDKEGNVMITEKMKAMVLTTSCDIENDENITLCPMFENSDLKPETLESVKNNKKYDTLYIDSKKLQNYHARFSICNTYNKEFIFKALADGSIKKIFTMSMITYYLFIIKLSIHYMRFEDTEVKELRKEKDLGDN